MAVAHETFAQVPRWAMIARLPFQFGFGWITWRGTR
jgi:uncharacterized membrane protein